MKVRLVLEDTDKCYISNMNYDSYYVSFDIDEPNLFRITLPVSELNGAYKKGIKILGFDPFKECTLTYGNLLDVGQRTHVSFLSKHNLLDIFDSYEIGGEKCFFIRKQDFHLLYLRICNIGNRLLHYTDLSGTNTVSFL